MRAALRACYCIASYKPRRAKNQKLKLKIKIKIKIKTKGKRAQRRAISGRDDKL
ncbi:hypothetical protein [Lysobacter capsici]|uniref:hypothetical protein n=1 Tax=Lysobacter capsici TaxID=435897 RepID=UPI00287BBD44|nr:hypothetical protein [Lysobacter capsici]WND79292.1 hypothetical protein RJ610_18605 [Lysobacter capsici]WND84488.1 hypothetical protein RJ609_18620 [Lysobacter capsici]